MKTIMLTLLLISASCSIGSKSKFKISCYMGAINMATYLKDQGLLEPESGHILEAWKICDKDADKIYKETE